MKIVTAVQNNCPGPLVSDNFYPAKCSSVNTTECFHGIHKWVNSRNGCAVMTAP